MFFNPLGIFTQKYESQSLIYADGGTIKVSGSCQWEDLVALKPLSGSLGLAAGYRSGERGSEGRIDHDGNEHMETMKGTLSNFLNLSEH